MRRFGDWNLFSSTRKTYSVGPNRHSWRSSIVWAQQSRFYVRTEAAVSETSFKLKSGRWIISKDSVVEIPGVIYSATRCCCLFEFFIIIPKCWTFKYLAVQLLYASFLFYKLPNTHGNCISCRLVIKSHSRENQVYVNVMLSEERTKA
jgi:hypothetical protein